MLLLKTKSLYIVRSAFTRRNVRLSNLVYFDFAFDCDDVGLQKLSVTLNAAT